MLVIDRVDQDRIDASPAGWVLTSQCRDALDRRFDQLAASGLRLRVDLSRVSAIDAEVVEVFDRAAAMLRGSGGVLEVTGVGPEIADAFGLPATTERSAVMAVPVRDPQTRVRETTQP